MFIDTSKHRVVNIDVIRYDSAIAVTIGDSIATRYMFKIPDAPPFGPGF